MATAATSLLGLALPVTGELSGTWGDAVNVSITALLDTAVAGTTTLSSDADVTLTTTTLAANQARQAIILWTAGGTATRTITVPAQSKSYIVINKTSSSQSIKIVGAGPTTGVTIVAGTAALVVWNGVDFVTASVTSTTGVLPVANGGTGLTAGTSGGVLAYTAAGTLASSTALAANALVIGGGAGAAPSTTTTGTGVLTFLGTPSSANLAAAVTDETGTGALVFATSPTFVTPALGTPASGTVTNLTGTASININGTVGATTASTGAFTTLTTSSTVTVNGGTANGVAFLDASKVLTTGSALTFDGTTLTSAVGTSAANAIFNSTANTPFITFSQSGAAKFFIGESSIVGGGGAGNYDLFAATGLGIRFFANNTETMRLTSTGLKSSIAGTNADPVFSYTADTNTGIFFPAADKLGFTAGGGTDQMVLTSTGLGIGTSSPGEKLQVAGAIRATGAVTANATGGILAYQGSGTTMLGAWGANTSTVGQIQFYVASSDGSVNGEIMRVTGTGLGIGTSSPSEKLEILTASSASTPAAIFRSAAGVGNTGGLAFYANDTNASARNWYFVANSNAYGDFVIRVGASQGANPTSGNTVATFSSSGNLGLGVTPTGTSKFEVYTGNTALNGVTSRFNAANHPIALASTTSNGFPYVGFNTVQVVSSDNQTYAVNGFASRISHILGPNGGFQFNVAPSGTAGNAISFTQAMTLDADGNLMVGATTSPYSTSGRAVITLNDSTSVIYALQTGGTNRGYIYADGTSIDMVAESTNDLKLTTAGAKFISMSTNNTERARIDDNGTFRVKGNGTAGSTDAFQVAGGAPADAARIDSSGNLLVGTTTQIASEKFGVNSGSGAAGKFKGGSDANVTVDIWNPATSGDNIFVAFRTETAETTRGSISFNRAGGLVAYNTTSDYRAKDISGPVTDSGALIDATPVYMGKMKGATQERPMFIAHEVPAYAHTGEKDAVDADGNPVYQQMDASALVPVMWAEIKSLRQRLAAAGI